MMNLFSNVKKNTTMQFKRSTHCGGFIGVENMMSVIVYYLIATKEKKRKSMIVYLMISMNLFQLS